MLDNFSNIPAPVGLSGALDFLAFDPFSNTLFVSEDFEVLGADTARIFRVRSDGTFVQFGKDFWRPNGFSFHVSGVMLVSESDNLTVVDGWRFTFRRGDANADGMVDNSDSVFIQEYLFNGGPAPPCWDAADANDDARIDLSDVVFIQEFLFQGGPPPPAPGPNACGFDPTIDLLGCRQYQTACAISF